MSTDHFDADLKGRSVRGGAATVVTQAARFALQFACIPVLARLLTPADFGLVGMVAVVTGFVGLFKDAGLSMATVQRKEITHAQISTLFWFNVCLSVVLALLLACLAPGVAWFYGEPRLTSITLALAGTFVFGGLAVQHSALLRRQMRFGTLGVIAVISQAVSIASGILAAALGAGYWALVIMAITVTGTTALLVWVASGWRPGLPRRGAGVRPMLTFGGNLAGAQFLKYVQGTTDKFLIGWDCGADALGVYSKAYKLLVFPLNQIKFPIGGVAIPALSRLQDQPERYCRYFYKGLEALAILGVPIIIFAFADVDNLVLTMLGDQWHEVIPIFRVLVPAALVETLNIGGAWILVSSGRTDLLLRISIPNTLAVVLGCVIGLQWGPLGVAVGYSATTCVASVLPMLIAFRLSPVTLAGYCGTIWRPLTASALAAATLIAARGLGATFHVHVVDLVLDALFFFTTYLVATIALPGGRRCVRECLAMLRSLRSRDQSKAP